jgi:hypothetical protein
MLNTTVEQCFQTKVCRTVFTTFNMHASKDFHGHILNAGQGGSAGRIKNILFGFSTFFGLPIPMLVSVFLIHVLISLSVTATTLVIDVMKYEICGAVSGSLAEFKRLIRIFG